MGGALSEATVMSAPKLRDGSKVAVIGGGPAGSLFAYFAQDMAMRTGIELDVDIYEPRDFSLPAPKGCNMCGGIISETLVQNLAIDGINLPSSVVRRGIDSYHLHTDRGSVLIETPLDEKRIAAVYRGSGPRDIKEFKWESFDGHLLDLAVEKGANVVRQRVRDFAIDAEGKPQVIDRYKKPVSYDLLVSAVGINSPATKAFASLDIGYTQPEGTKTYICEHYFGSDVIEETLGSSMHVFLLNIPRLEFAAIIPKGDYATICMLGDDIDKELIASFLESKEVAAMMPPGWNPQNGSCNCFPRINVAGPAQPYGERFVFIGDSGVTRLYKDGIGAAYRTAKAAASTAVFQGIAAKDFQKFYQPACKRIKFDNSIGRLSFLATDLIKKFGFTRLALVNMTADEQASESRAKRMSTVMWDLFTGSAPYKEIFLRTLNPIFLLRFVIKIIGAGFQDVFRKDN